MAEGCIHYGIEIDQGNGWVRKLSFRDTPTNADTRFDAYCKVAPACESIRLVEGRVLRQKNRFSCKNP